MVAEKARVLRSISLVLHQYAQYLPLDEVELELEVEVELEVEGPIQFRKKQLG